MKKILLSLAITTFSIFSANAQPTGIAVSPLKLNIEKISDVQTITLNNLSEHSKSYQIEILKWDNIDEKDVFSKTNNFIISPLIVKINPNTKQIIRIGTKNIQQSSNEQSYRIFFKQLPAKHTKGVQVLTNISIPVFISPTNKYSEIKSVSEYLKITPIVKNSNLQNINVVNNFNQHIKIVGLNIIQNNKKIYSEKNLKYILSHKTQNFNLNGIKIKKNIPIDFVFELQGYDNVKKQFIVK